MRKRSANIGKKRGKRAELGDWLSARPGLEVGEADFEELRRALAPVSENYLRKLLRESGAPLSAMVDGVRQASLDELESSLARLLEEYETGDPAHRARIRQMLILSKDHARWAARNPERRLEREEMGLWMLTWLENPPVFRQWARLRREELSRAGPGVS
jgi:hypothetical protein